MGRPLVAGALALACSWLACAPIGSHTTRIEDVAQRGDPQRRASTDFVLKGLAADAAGDARRALSRYERAMQVDSGNPYAHLALARHHVEHGEYGSALAYLDQAEMLFESQETPSPGVEAHLAGLRGVVLSRAGRRRDGDALLREAARRAPDVWADGWLDADELR